MVVVCLKKRIQIAIMGTMGIPTPNLVSKLNISKVAQFSKILRNFTDKIGLVTKLRY